MRVLSAAVDTDTVETAAKALLGINIAAVQIEALNTFS